MPAPSKEAPRETKPLLDLGVVSWRYECLAGVGYPVEEAIALAESSEVDLHTAIDLLLQGCPLEQALRILL